MAPTDRDISCDVDRCTCSLEEVATVEALIHINEGHAACAHHADAAADLAVAPFPCQVPRQRGPREDS